MNSISKQPTSSFTTKVTLESEQPSATNVSNALAELKKNQNEDKTLYLRTDKHGNTQLTTKAPKWYQSLSGRRDGKAEKEAAAKLFLSLLNNTSLPLNNLVKLDLISAAKSIVTAERAVNSESLRENIKTVAGAVDAANSKKPEAPSTFSDRIIAAAAAMPASVQAKKIDNESDKNLASRIGIRNSRPDDIDDVLAGGSDVSKAVNPTEITEAQKSQISQIMNGFTATANSGPVGALGNRSLSGTIGATEAAKSAGKQIASLFKETEVNQEGTPNKASGEREVLKQNVINFLKDKLIVSSPIRNQGVTKGSQEHAFMNLIVNSFSEAFEKA